MPQLSLYIDEKTLKKLEIAAKIEHLSISRYAVKKLNESLHGSWPDSYAALFGCLEDDTFVIERPADFNDDGRREQL